MIGPLSFDVAMAVLRRLDRVARHRVSNVNRASRDAVMLFYPAPCIPHCAWATIETDTVCRTCASSHVIQDDRFSTHVTNRRTFQKYVLSHRNHFLQMS